MISPPVCSRCRGKHRPSQDCPVAPTIVFTKAPRPLPSTGTTVRFAILPVRGGIVTLEADWYLLPWEMTPGAAKTIFDYVEQTRAGVSAGGGNSCLRLRVRKAVAEEIVEFVGRVLSSPRSWKRINYISKFPKNSLHTFGCTNSTEMRTEESE